MNPNQQPQQPNPQQQAGQAIPQAPPIPAPQTQQQQPPPPQPQQPQQQPGPPMPQQQYAQPGQQQPQPQGPPQANRGGSAPQTPVQTNPNSTQNTLEIAEIRDGIVIMNDGSYRSIILAQSINFDLMSPQERESVEFSYQGFLNSLYFPIQIVVRSQKVDLRPYMQKLEKLQGEQDNMLLSFLMEDYITYIQLLTQETNIMDKQFYIVIPYFTEADAQQAVKSSKSILNSVFGGKKKGTITIHEGELETAKSELKNRVQTVLSSLVQMGVQGIPLDTQELIELYYDVYNPDTATHQRSLQRSDFSAPVVTKGTGTANQSHLDSEVGR